MTPHFQPVSPPNASRRARRPDAGGWHPAVRSLHLSPRLAHWLQEPGSLTARIIRAAGPQAVFSVEVLRQEAALPLADEADLIATRRDHLALARDVVLKVDGVPVIFAHTVLALRHARHPWPWLGRIGQRPLGSVLFTHHDILPGPHHYGFLDRRHPLYRAAAPWCHNAAPTQALPLHLPARRACFFQEDSPLLVTEVFLPALLDRCSP